jgi:hypothetical protein
MQYITRTLIIIILLVISIVLFPLLSSCEHPPSQPINANLSFSDPPLLNKPVKITAIFSIPSNYYNAEAQNVSAQILIPDGFEKLDGDINWKGNIPRGKSQTLKATVKSIKIGNWQVIAKAEFDPSKAEHYIGDAILYVSVSEKEASISDHVPTSTFSR